MMDKGSPLVLFIAILLMAAYTLGGVLKNDEIADDCKVVNRTVIYGKPYICHPMPEGTGHHD